ncbi:hypothetical protein ES707_19449 [subsurface metagenome]
MPVALAISIIFLAAGNGAVSADGEYYRVRTVVLDGISIDEIIINGPPTPPPGFERTTVELPEPNIAAGINTLSNVPALDWSYGCSATSAAMIAGYYDRTLYSNMYAGATSGGVFPLPTDDTIWGSTAYGGTYPTTCMECPLSATHNGVDSRSTDGHVDDYWVEYGSTAADPFDGNWTEHTYGECTGDYMKTNQDAYGNTDGSTTFWYYTNGAPISAAQLEALGVGYYDVDGGYGLKLFYESRGYTVTSMYNQYIEEQGSTPGLGFTYAQYKAEIDAGRPVMIHLAGHTIVGIGYNDDTTNRMYVHDTWDYSSHLMTWNSTYGGMQHIGVTIVQLQSPGAQSWYLHNDDVMYKGVTNKTEGSVSIGASASNIWIADEAATADVTFSSSAWTGQVVFTSAPTGGGTPHTFTVETGSSTDGSDFTAGGPDATLTGDGSATVFNYTTDAASFTVTNGEYLALRITNNSASAYSVTTGLTWSYTDSPSSEPGYPVPELPTIILFSLGLAGFGIYYWLRKRPRTLATKS